MVVGGTRTRIAAGPCDGVEEGWVAQRGQGDEEQAIGEVWRQSRQQFQGEVSLAAAAGSSQSEQPEISALDQGEQRGDLACTTDQRGGWRGQCRR